MMSTPLKLRIRCGGICAVTLSTLFASSVFAQTNEEDDEVFEFSPFVVESKEGEYRATSTLAGTRLRTNVSDIGSSISILTEQLMEDTGATDAGSLLQIVPNVEVAGELGNYSSATPDGGGAAITFFGAVGARSNISPTQRVRGLVSAQLTRNYFQTIIPFDSYNTSQVTVNRGPNSVLFGLGSPGGVIENTMRAPAAVNSSEVKVRFDHNGGHREELDLNRVFANGRLKIRASLMNEDKRYRQEEAFESDSRRYLAWDLKVREANDSLIGNTTFRGYFESGELDRNPPDAVPPTNNFRWWHDVSDYQQLIGNYPGIDSPADLPFNLRRAEEGGGWIPKGTVDNTDNSTNNRTVNYAPGFIWAVGVHQQPDAPAEIAGVNLFMPRLRWGGSRRTQDLRWTNSSWGPLGGFRNPTLMDRNVFDFVNHLYTGNTDTIRDDFNVQEFSLEQSFLNGDLGFEFSINRQSVDGYRYTPYSTGRARGIGLDVSEYYSLTTEIPSTPGDRQAEVITNPNLGRPAIANQGFNQDNTDRHLESRRATAYFQHDFNESLGDLGKWLGKHTASGLLQEYDDENEFFRETLNVDSDLVDVGAPNILNARYNDGRRIYATHIYVGESALDTTDPSEVRWDFPLTQATLPAVGEMQKFAYWDNATKQVAVTDAYTKWVPNHSSNISRQKVSSEAAILQSHWLDDHLVTLFAVRSDDVSNYEIIPEGNTRLPDGSFDVANLKLQDEPSFQQTGDTITKSYVLKFPEAYLFELPFDADLRVHYFESETFQPSGIARDIEGQVLDNPNGSTEEYGFSIDLLDQRLSLRVNWYETGSNNSRLGTALGRINEWVGASENGWLGRAAEFEATGADVSDILDYSAPGNPVPQTTFDSWDEYLAVVDNAAPEPFYSLIGRTFDRASGTVSGPGIEGLNSTFDFVSKGMEVELGGAITDNWNLVFNVARQETVQANTLPKLLEFAETVEAYLISTGLYDLQDSPSLNEPTTFGARWANSVLFPIRNEQAKNGQKSPEQREWRWNLVSSYRFDEGALKGFAFGGVARWQDEVAVGYPVTLNQDGNIVNDIANPFFGPDQFNADAWVRYRRKIMDDKIDWTVQLNVRNLIGGDSDEFIPISIDPLGNVQAIRTSPERQIFVTNSFKF